MYKVYYPSNKAYRGDKRKNANDKGSGILGFKITSDAVYAANKRAEKDLDNDLYDLVELVVFGSVGIIGRHFHILLNVY